MLLQKKWRLKAIPKIAYRKKRFQTVKTSFGFRKLLGLCLENMPPRSD